MPAIAFRRSFVLLVAALFGTAIAVLSVAPIDRVALGTRPGFCAPPIAVQHAAELHFMAHILIFGAAAGVAWFAAISTASGRLGKVIALSLTLLLGCTTEYLQHKIYRNPLERYDVLINTCSIAAMFALLALLSRQRKHSGTHSNSGALALRLSEVD
jgi:hypothetical protein